MIINGNETVATICIILSLSIVVDFLFGELPTKIHPVVFIGKTIDFFSKHFINIKSRFTGFVLTFLVSTIVLVFFAVILTLASFNIGIFIITASIILSSVFSIKFLLSSARQIKKDLDEGIDVARKAMSYLVSRNTSNLSEKLIISATIETLSENITDSAISPVFYYIFTNIILIIIFKILSVFNIIQISSFISIYHLSVSTVFFIVIIAILVTTFYRIINTLDAMVGYKNEKYINIGYFPAKLDDILNFIPSRFGGIMVVLASIFYKKLGINWKKSYKIMKRDARKTSSPNSGYTMAAVAGAFDICLIKEGVYSIGDDNVKLKKEHIEKSIKLSRLGIYLAIIQLISIFFILLNIIFAI